MFRESPPDSDFPCSEPVWVALQYLLGELSEPAAAEFEARLASDVEWAEAFGQAVALREALAACHLESSAPAELCRPCTSRTSSVAEGWLSSPPARRGDWRRIVAGSVAAVALLALGWFGRGLGPQGTVTPSAPEGSLTQANGGTARTADADSLLAAWVSLEGDGVGAAADEPLADLTPGAVGGDVDADVPGWLMAALLAPSDGPAFDGRVPDDRPEPEDL